MFLLVLIPGIMADTYQTCSITMSWMTTNLGVKGHKVQMWQLLTAEVGAIASGHLLDPNLRMRALKAAFLTTYITHGLSTYEYSTLRTMSHARDESLVHGQGIREVFRKLAAA